MARLLAPSPLLRSALPRPSLVLPRTSLLTLTKPTTHPSRLLSHLPALRPTTLLRPSIFRAPTQITPTAGAEAVDVLPKTSVTAHPALASVGAQMRCGPRPTMSGATRLIQKRRHGFLSRVKTKNGRNTLQRRRAKGRKRLSA